MTITRRLNLNHQSQTQYDEIYLLSLILTFEKGEEGEEGEKRRRVYMQCQKKKKVKV